jgi:hypothetical protein
MTASDRGFMTEAATLLRHAAQNPAGMVLVPREPTAAMVAAWESAEPEPGWLAIQHFGDAEANAALCKAEWSAMLAALPARPVVGKGMKPWSGGPCAPDDWDGKTAVDRRGIVGTYHRKSEAWQRRSGDLPDDIVAYAIRRTPQEQEG